MNQPIIHNAVDRAAVANWIDLQIGETQEERSNTLNKADHRHLSRRIDDLLKMRLVLCGNPKCGPFAG